jgi:uncharacterized membrane protein HdeD (DUF308 family)
MKPETVNTGRTGPGWSMIWGIIMFACGVLAITLPLAFSIGIVVVLAWLILLAAVVHLVFAFHSHSIGGFLWKLLLALFYGAVGTYMVMNPLLGVTSVTIVVAILFLCEGLVELALYFHIRHAAYAGWVLVDGIITLVVGFSHLGSVAVQCGLGAWHARRNQPHLQWHF